MQCAARQHSEARPGLLSHADSLIESLKTIHDSLDACIAPADPGNMIKAVQQITGAFQSGLHHDAQKFISCVIDTMQEISGQSGVHNPFAFNTESSLDIPSTGYSSTKTE